MAPPHSKPRLDAAAGMASPLGVAISAGDQETIAMVKEAVRTRRLRLAYQPVVLTRDTGRVAFYEGLIRVQEPNGRIIPAGDFINAVEGHELGREIDCAALEYGLATLAKQPQLRISINMSARSIGYPRWTRILKRALSANPGIGDRLILEITESSAMLVPELVTAFMDELQSTGVTFALDDFGSGQTSFRYLREFFFDILKIDGQFTRGVARDADNQALAGALIAVGRHFDMLTVAEAVETPEDAAFLCRAGIGCLQGYLYGVPTVCPAWDDSGDRRRA